MPEARKRPAATSTSGLSARLLELHAETNSPEPYEVADGVVVLPLNRKRRAALHQAEWDSYVTTTAYQEAVKQLIAPTVPTEPGDDADDEARDEYAKAKFAFEAWESSEKPDDSVFADLQKRS